MLAPLCISPPSLHNVGAQEVSDASPPRALPPSPASRDWPHTCDEDESREAGEGRDIHNQAVQGPRESQNAVDPVAEATGTLQMVQHTAGAEDEFPLGWFGPSGQGCRWRSGGLAGRAAGQQGRGRWTVGSSPVGQAENEELQEG